MTATLQAFTWPAALIAQRSAEALAIGRVARISSAATAGLRAGWYLLSIDGQLPSTDVIDAAYVTPASEIVFLDPASGEVWALCDQLMPLGLQFVPVLNAALVRGLRSGAVPIHEALALWAGGDTASYAALVPDFEAALTPALHRVLGPLISKPKRLAAMLGSLDRWSQLGLSLGYLAQGNAAMAEHMARAYFDNLGADPDAGDMSMTLCAAYHVLADVARRAGDTQAALELVEEALGIDPTALPPRALFKALTQTSFLPPEPPGQMMPFERYHVLRTDPYGIHASGGELDLDAALKAMRVNDYGLICVLGPYRSNGPFLEGLTRLIALSTGRAPAFTHVLTGWTGDVDTEVSQIRIAREDALLRSGAQFEVGFTPDESLLDTYAIEALPTWFVVDNQGIIHARGIRPDHSDILAAITQITQA